MNNLVDTHTFLWIVLASKALSKSARAVLVDSESINYVSVVTFWEISLKFSLGKLNLKGILPESLPTWASDTGFEILNLGPKVASSFYKLPILDHKDPFDRLLVWQAISSRYVLVSKDKELKDYEKHGLSLIW